MAIWLDGERFETTRAPFDLSDRGLLLGDGVFDTALVLKGRIVFRQAHLDRLERACGTLGFPLDRALAGTSMDRAAEEAGIGSVRLTATRGTGPRGIAPPPEPRPTILASNVAGPPVLAFSAVRLHQTDIRRNETSPASRVKALNYLDAVLALGEARRLGFDEALFLNTAGRIASAGSGNLFALFGDELATPPVSDGILPGILRALVLRLAPRIGLRPAERRLYPEELATADSLFMTNSLRLLAPVRAVGDFALPTAGEGLLRQLAERICEAISEDCGADALAFLEPGQVQRESS